MEEALTLIDKIIEEHKTIIQRLHTLEQVANDAEAIAGFEKAKDVFMPERFGQKQSLQKLQELVQTIAQGLQTHFDREETTLLGAFEKCGDKNLVSSLHSLLLEHEDLRNRLAYSKEHVTELIGKELSHSVWEAKAYDMRAYISHTRKLVEAHAEIEQELMLRLRRQLTGEERL